MNRDIAPDRLRQIDDSLAAVRTALLALRFGSVAITVHDGCIVQIDVTEKTRLAAR